MGRHGAEWLVSRQHCEARQSVSVHHLSTVKPPLWFTFPRWSHKSEPKERRQGLRSSGVGEEEMKTIVHDQSDGPTSRARNGDPRFLPSWELSYRLPPTVEPAH
jgi:hypothetical protein